MNPGARPRRTIAALAGAAAVIAGVTVLAVGGVSKEAEAEALQRFSSCAQLQAWGEQSTGAGGFGTEEFTAVGEAVDADGVAEVAPSGDRQSSSTADAAGGVDGTGGDLDTGGTNVIVAGVDELDLIDRIDGDVWLVAGADRLAVVDVAAGERLASVEVGFEPRVSYDPDRDLAWVTGQDPDDWTLSVQRVAVSTDTLTVEGSWKVDGHLVAARRIGGQLHLVATDGFHGDRGPVLPFDGEPVPCDQVLHPEGPSDPSATLVATFDPAGPVEPSAVTQVVGSGQFVHLTHDAVYLATPQWNQETVTTGIHRFALEGLSLTGSGAVEGSLLNEFSMSEHDGHLRVAVTHGGGGFFVGPVDVDIAVDVAEPTSTGGDDPVSSDQFTDDIDRAPTSVPTTTMPGQTEPDPGSQESMPLPEPVEPEPLPTDPSISPPIAPVEPPDDPEPESVLNEIVVLDIQGDLDVVGRTDRFGKPWETIHGIRFVGEVAYAVTFLTTDPFYVVDLADPAAPTVVGDLELPGFSSYLHPIGEDHVVGFGPDERGQASAKLFDVSDPTAPAVIDSIGLGSDSVVAWDHHAFVSLGDTRFAVPTSDYRRGLRPGCTEEDQSAQEAESERLYQEFYDLEEQASIDDDWTTVEEAWMEVDRKVAELPCAHLDGYSVSAAVTLEVVEGRLVEVERQESRSSSSAQRIIPSSAGWTFLDGGGHLVLLDPSGAERSTVSLTD